MDQLQKHRQQIDQIDAEIIRLIARRLEVVQKISKFKQNRQIPTLDQERWQKVLNSRADQAQVLGLDPELIKTIYEEIHKFILKIKA